MTETNNNSIQATQSRLVKKYQARQGAKAGIAMIGAIGTIACIATIPVSGGASLIPLAIAGGAAIKYHHDKEERKLHIRDTNPLNSEADCFLDLMYNPEDTNKIAIAENAVTDALQEASFTNPKTKKKITINDATSLRSVKTKEIYSCINKALNECGLDEKSLAKLSSVEREKLQNLIKESIIQQTEETGRKTKSLFSKKLVIDTSDTLTKKMSESIIQNKLNNKVPEFALHCVIEAYQGEVDTRSTQFKDTVQEVQNQFDAKQITNKDIEIPATAGRLQLEATLFLDSKQQQSESSLVLNGPHTPKRKEIKNTPSSTKSPVAQVKSSRADKLPHAVANAAELAIENISKFSYKIASGAFKVIGTIGSCMQSVCR